MVGGVEDWLVGGTGEEPFGRVVGKSSKSTVFDVLVVSN